MLSDNIKEYKRLITERNVLENTVNKLEKKYKKMESRLIIAGYNNVYYETIKEAFIQAEREYFDALIRLNKIKDEAVKNQQERINQYV